MLSSSELGESGLTATFRVAIIVVAYNGGEHLGDCLASLFASQDAAIQPQLVVVDNASSDGSPAFVREHFPSVTVLEAPENVGYAGGANLGWEHIRQHEPDVRYVAVLNQDTLAESGWLARLVEFLESHPRAAVAQPKLRLFPETDRINTAGNRSHYLGFGFMTGYREIDRGQYDEPRPIDFASGAALVVRRDFIERHGLFWADLWLYLEDMELGWRVRLSGHEVWSVPSAIVYHKHAAGAPLRRYGLFERNRWLLILTCYRLRTILLISPALLLMELGQCVFAARRRLLRDRLGVYTSLLRPATLRLIRQRRRATQRLRVLTDRQFLAGFSGRIDWLPFAASTFALRAANLVFGAWWRLVRPLLRW